MSFGETLAIVPRVGADAGSVIQAFLFIFSAPLAFVPG